MARRADTEFEDMSPSEAARKLVAQIRALPVANTPAVRAIRAGFSRRLAGSKPEFVNQLAEHLLSERSDMLRFVAYELISHHKQTFEGLGEDDLQRLGEGLDSWSSVDCFGMYLSGPTWAQGRVSDKTVVGWARSKDRWWRRAALVSTIALSRRSRAEDLVRVTRICALLTADRDTW